MVRSCAVYITKSSSGFRIHRRMRPYSREIWSQISGPYFFHSLSRANQLTSPLPPSDAVRSHIFNSLVTDHRYLISGYGTNLGTSHLFYVVHNSLTSCRGIVVRRLKGDSRLPCRRTREGCPTHCNRYPNWYTLSAESRHGSW